MTEYLVKTRKLGKSWVIILPKEVVGSERIKEGEVVKIVVKKIRKSGFGILKGVGPFTADDELKGMRL